jgi:AraC-like DNA-binding protein
MPSMPDTAITTFEPGTAKCGPQSPGKRRVAPSREAAVWQSIGKEWRQLYGGFYDLGVSIEWHDFQLTERFEWSRSFHPESFELCLNLSGCGSISCGEVTVELAPLTAAFYLTGKKVPQAWREADQRHRFITFEFSARFVRERLISSDGALHPLVEEFVRGDSPGIVVGEAHRLTAAQEQFINHLLKPPVPQAARSLWYQAKVLEMMSEFFFERKGEDELFCDRQKRLARERVNRVVRLLEEHLVDPLSLEEIGRQAGCSPFHLSRTFSAETGMTIPQYLRRLRMERAASLLRTGKCNVTEAAFAVGYSSLSHFSQAFCQTMGCCPGLYPVKRVNDSCTGFPPTQ